MKSSVIAPQPKRKSRLLIKVLFIYLIFSFMVMVFFVGYFYGLARPSIFSGTKIYQEIVNRAPEYVSDQEIDFGLFWQVWQFINNEYIKQPIDERAAFYGSLKGLVGSLGDPYSVFLDPEETERFDIEISGQFEGVGAEIGIKEDKLVVITPLPGSPAEQAGLKTGDYIMMIDDTETVGLSVDQAVQLIRGEKGTMVDLLVLHENETEPVLISITRDTIKTESLSWKMLDSNIAFISLTGFTNSTQTELSSAINEILLKEPRGLVLDLRNNPGGYLDVAIDAAGEFLDNKLVVVEKFSSGQRQEHYSDGQHRLKDLPTVVLIGPGTASAAEILAGALQDHQAARLVGEKTFGKGSVQDYTEFDDGSSLKITVAEWLTPEGRSIDKLGITPDIEIEYSYEDYQAGIDPQLDKATEILSSSL